MKSDETIQYVSDDVEAISDDLLPLAGLEVPHWPATKTAARREKSSAKLADLHEPAGDATRNHVIILATGADDAGKRATFAFAAACAAISLDLDTQVFLIGDGSHWAYEGNSDAVQQDGFPPLSELMSAYIDLGGAVYVCATCDTVCAVPGADGRTRRRRSEIEPRGLAAVLSHMAGGTSVTF